MKKIILSVLILILFLSACSKKVETKLRINNKTSADIWIKVNNQSQQTIVPNSFKEYSWLLNSGGLTGDETQSVSMQYNGYTIFSAGTTIVLNAGDYKTINIKPNGGCIKILNDSQAFYIEEVYISPSDSLYWGDNLLLDAQGNSFTIDPGNFQTWTCTADTWDIKVVDDYGDEFTAMETHIAIDEVFTFVYTGFKKQANKSNNKKKGGYIKGVESNR